MIKDCTWRIGDVAEVFCSGIKRYSFTRILIYSNREELIYLY